MPPRHFPLQVADALLQWKLTMCSWDWWLMREREVGGCMWRADGGWPNTMHINAYQTLTLLLKRKSERTVNALQRSSVSDSSLSPHVYPSVNWFDAYGADNEGCEWMKVCHSVSSSPLYAATLSCLISTNHLLCISIYMRKGRQSRVFYTCQT